MKSSQRKADIISTLDPSVDPFLELSIMCTSKFPPFFEEGNQTWVSVTGKKRILTTITSMYLVFKSLKIIFSLPSTPNQIVKPMNRDQISFLHTCIYSVNSTLSDAQQILNKYLLTETKRVFLIFNTSFQLEVLLKKDFCIGRKVRLYDFKDILYHLNFMNILFLYFTDLY